MGERARRGLVSAAVVLSVASGPALPPAAGAAVRQASPAALAAAPGGSSPQERPQSKPAAEPEKPATEGGQAGQRTSEAPSDLGVSLDRIRRGLERKPTGILDAERPTFRVYIEGRLPTFAEFYANEDFGGGPAGWVPRGHQEFLDMVTPKEAQPFGAFTGKDLLLIGAQSLASGLVANTLFNTLPRAIRDARRSREEAEARREVQEVLEELARRKAEAEAAARKNSADPPPSPPSKPVQ